MKVQIFYNTSVYQTSDFFIDIDNKLKHAKVFYILLLHYLFD